MPYDAHDSPFLAEMKVSAAEYQTHSLAIANSHYDKDAASEAKLRHLVDFCDAYAHWQGAAAAAATAGASPAEPADNVDSDDDEFIVSSGSSGSSKPLHAGGAGSPPPMELKQQQPQHKRQQRRVESKRPAADNAPSDSSDDDDDDDHEAKLRADSDDDDCGAAVQDEQEYMPDRIVAKKTVRWQNFYLIHWLGYSEAERTWEPAAFFDEYCTKQTHDFYKSRVPVRIVSQRLRAGGGAGASSSSAAAVYYEVQWQGQVETTLEPAADLADRPQLLEDWQQREQQRAARKHRRSSSSSGTNSTASETSQRPPKSRRLQGKDA
jgi:hypothetical protein